MSRVFISAGLMIVVVLAILWFSSGEQAPVEPVVEETQPQAAAPRPPQAPEAAAPAAGVATGGEVPQEEGTIEVQGQLEDVESLRDEMDEERRALMAQAQAARALERQALLDEIESPGEDNERVVAMNKNLHNATLEKADLRLIDLSRANGVDADLTEAKLQGADLSQANLQGVKLKGADLTGALIDGADMRGADLENATLRVRGQAVDLRAAKLDGASLDGADLTRADLRNSSFRGASLGALMTGADLRLSNFGRADFLDAVLTDANLEDADLREANNLTCEQLQKAQNWAAAKRSPDLACGAPLPEPPAPAE